MGPTKNESPSGASMGMRPSGSMFLYISIQLVDMRVQYTDHQLRRVTLSSHVRGRIHSPQNTAPIDGYDQREYDANSAIGRGRRLITEACDKRARQE